MSRVVRVIRAIRAGRAARAAPAAAPVVVVGAGWAGLAAAAHLVDSGRRVTLIEAARQPGGRARSAKFDGLTVDNGQHIALGAYRDLLKTCQRIGLDESRVFRRMPLRLHVRGDETTVALRAPRLPAPLHLLAAFAGARGLDWADKRNTLLHWPALIRATQAELTVAELWRRADQAERVCRYLWRPLCIGALNTYPEQASARLFQAVLKDAFMRRRADSDILLPRRDLARVFPRPAVEWLSRRGANIILGARVVGLNAADGAVSGVATREREFAATQVVLATDAPSAARLMRPLPELGELRRRLTRLEYEPITTLYFRYPKPVALRPAMQGYAERMTQWLFDRRITGHDNVLAAVISAGGEHMAWDKEELVRHVMRDIQSAAAQDTAALSAPIATLVIREKRATFAATPTMDALRPPQQTALRGLVLAGDYTQTGYPATLEGAVRSGIRAAEALA